MEQHELGVQCEEWDDNYYFEDSSRRSYPSAPVHHQDTHNQEISRNDKVQTDDRDRDRDRATRDRREHLMVSMRGKALLDAVLDAHGRTSKIDEDRHEDRPKDLEQDSSTERDAVVVDAVAGIESQSKDRGIEDRDDEAAEERSEAERESLIKDLLRVVGTEKEAIRSQVHASIMKLGCKQVESEFSKVRAFAVVAAALLERKSRSWRRIHEILFNDDGEVLTDQDFNELKRLVESDQLIQPPISEKRIKKKRKLARDKHKDRKSRKGNSKQKRINNRHRRFLSRKARRELRKKDNEAAREQLLAVYNTLERCNVEHYGKTRDEIPKSSVMRLMLSANRFVRAWKEMLMDSGSSMQALDPDFADRAVRRTAENYQRRHQHKADARREHEIEQKAEEISDSNLTAGDTPGDTELESSETSIEDYGDENDDPADDIPITRLIPDGLLKANKGQAMLVENGGERDVVWDGTYYWMYIKHPLYQNLHVKMPFYRSPTPLPYDVIIGRDGMRQLGLRTILTEKVIDREVYHHPRERALFDVDSASNTWQQMDYCAGNTLAELIAEGKRRAEAKDESSEVKESLNVIEPPHRSKSKALTVTAERDVDSDAVPVHAQQRNQDRHGQTTEQRRTFMPNAMYVDDDNRYCACRIDRRSGDMARLLLPDDGVVIVHYDRVRELVADLIGTHEKSKNELHNDDDELEPDLNDTEHADLYTFTEDFIDLCPLSVRDEILNIVTDVRLRRGVAIARRLKTILCTHQTRIAKSKFDIGCITGIEYEVPLKPGHRDPIYCNPYPTSPHHQKIIDETVEALLQCGFIEPYDGPWAAPVLMIENNDGSWRMCVDYSIRNSITQTNAYPCPNINDSLQSFRGKKVFSKFDLCKAFHNIRVKPEHRARTAFCTRNGQYCWKVMPFGCKNAPATWARASDFVFRACPDLIKYVDDLAVASENDDAHLDAIEAFFGRLSSANLKVKLSKCEFFKEQITFVGHVISHNRITANRQYIHKIVRLSEPKTKGEVGSYCGIVQWLAKYCYRLKDALQPIAKLKKKKVKFEWGPEQQRAHLLVKAIIEHAEPLRMPDWTKPFYIWSDASEVAMGGVLMQWDEDMKDYVPIEFMSKAWADSEINWSVSTKELAAVLRCVEKWHVYVQHAKFVIHSDAKNVEWILKKLSRPRSDNGKGNKMHSRWALKLRGHDFDVKHIPGVDNIVADYLSRYNDFKSVVSDMVDGGVPDGYDSETSVESSETSISSSSNGQMVGGVVGDGGDRVISKPERAGADSDVDEAVEHAVRAAQPWKTQKGHDLVEVTKPSLSKTSKLKQSKKTLQPTHSTKTDYLMVMNDKRVDRRFRRSLYALRRRSRLKQITKSSLCIVESRGGRDFVPLLDLYADKSQARRAKRCEDQRFVRDFGGGKGITRDKIDAKFAELMSESTINQYMQQYEHRDLLYLYDRNQDDLYISKHINEKTGDIDWSRNRMNLTDYDNRLYIDVAEYLNYAKEKLFVQEAQNRYNDPSNYNHRGRDEREWMDMEHPDDEDDSDYDPGQEVDAAEAEETESNTPEFALPGVFDSDDSVISSRASEIRGDVFVEPVQIADEGKSDIDLMLRQQQKIDLEFDRSDLLLGQRADPFLCEVREYVESGPNFDEQLIKSCAPRMKGDALRGRYSVDPHTQLLRYQHPKTGKFLFVLPPTHRHAFMNHIHSNFFTGCHAKPKTMAYELIRSGYYWPGFHRDIKWHVRACHACQMAHATRHGHTGKMKLYGPDTDGDWYSIDHKGPILPVTPQGNKYITSVIDCFTGKVVSYAVPEIDALSTAKILLRHCTREGMCRVLQSDQGSDLIGEIVRHFCEIANVTKIKASTYYPEGNAQVERWHRVLNAGVKVIRTAQQVDFENGDAWEPYVDQLNALINNRVSRRMGMSPNDFGRGGRRFRTPIIAETELKLMDPRTRKIRRWNEICSNYRRMAIAVGKLKLEKYDEQRKRYYDQKKKDHKFVIGDRVIYYVGRKPNARSRYGKLVSRWDGPFKIINMWNDNKNVSLRRIDSEDTRVIRTNTKFIRKYFVPSDIPQQHRYDGVEQDDGGGDDADGQGRGGGDAADGDSNGDHTMSDRSAHSNQSESADHEPRQPSHSAQHQNAEYPPEQNTQPFARLDQEPEPDHIADAMDAADAERYRLPVRPIRNAADNVVDLDDVSDTEIDYDEDEEEDAFDEEEDDEEKRGDTGDIDADAAAVVYNALADDKDRDRGILAHDVPDAPDDLQMSVDAEESPLGSESIRSEDDSAALDRALTDSVHGGGDRAVRRPTVAPRRTPLRVQAERRHSKKWPHPSPPPLPPMPSEDVGLEPLAARNDADEHPRHVPVVIEDNVDVGSEPSLPERDAAVEPVPKQISISKQMRREAPAVSSPMPDVGAKRGRDADYVPDSDMAGPPKNRRRLRVMLERQRRIGRNIDRRLRRYRDSEDG